MAYFLGVDQGSNSSRAVLFDVNGDVITTASETVALTRSEGGRVEHDADQLLNSVDRVIQQVLSELDRREQAQVRACGIATQRSTALAWDAGGQALGPALSWQDVRAKDMLADLEPHAQLIMQQTGLPLTPYYSASKMHWLLHCSSAVMRCPRERLRLSPLASFLLYHLLENRPYRIDYSNAQRSLLFDLETLAWSERLCHWFGLDPVLLPECTPMCAAYGELRGAGIPVTAVCGDQNAAMYGSGQLGADMALVNIGSGAFILRELDRFSITAKQLTGIAFADGENVAYMREATINGAGNALTWAERQWQIDDRLERLPQWLRAIDNPPVFLNTIGGLGTPWMQGGLHSYFIGAGDFSNAERIVAIIESIVFLIQVNLELMHAEAPLRKLRLSGGLSNLDALCQKLANLSGLEVERAGMAEATARGVAWLAAGRPANWQHSPSGGDAAIIDYRPEQDEALRNRYEIFRKGMRQLLDNKPVDGSAI